MWSEWKEEKKYNFRVAFAANLGPILAQHNTNQFELDWILLVGMCVLHCNCIKIGNNADLTRYGC